MKASMASLGFAGRMAVALIVAPQVLACGSSFEPALDRAPSLPIASSSPSGLSLIWRNRELHPVDQPIAIGDVVVGIVADDRKAFVVSIDPATGRKLWQQRLTHSTLPAGVKIRLIKVGDDKVGYLRLISEDDPFANLVVADARNGKEIARSPEGRFSSYPIMCANGKDVCAISRLHFEQRQQYRLDLASGDYIVESDRLLPGTRFIDDTGLVDLGDRPGNTLLLLRNGRVPWHIPLSTAFPEGSSTDNGWHWNLYADPKVYVGAVARPGARIGAYYVIDLASLALAGLSERTGEVLWRNSGSNLHCNLNSRDYPVRCRSRGKIWYHTKKGSFHLAGLDVTVEGFDPVSGKTTWSLPMGFAEALESPTILPAMAGPGQVIVNVPNGPVMLDYAKGTLGAPEPGATFWCMATAYYEMAPPHQVRSGAWEYRHRGGEVASICDERRRPSTQLPSIAATMATGARVGDYAVIATRDGYLGFKAPAP